MSDRREMILLQELKKEEVGSFPQGIYNAMDQRGKEMCLDLLEYMAKNLYNCYWLEDDNGNKMYRFCDRDNDSISKEQLFDNFL